MSLIRDSRRLERLSRHLANLTEEGADTEAGFHALDRAANYVVNFNMAALFRIQTDLFVNFLRRHLCDEESLGRFCAGRDAVAETDAFRDLIQTIDKYRVRSVDVGRELVSRFQSCRLLHSDFRCMPMFRFHRAFSMSRQTLHPNHQSHFKTSNGFSVMSLGRLGA